MNNTNNPIIRFIDEQLNESVSKLVEAENELLADRKKINDTCASAMIRLAEIMKELK